jgi:putative SOS response-associated peptidase YedK
MCNRARLRTDPETLRETFGAKWLAAIPNKPAVELYPKSPAPVIRSADGRRIIDMMKWGVLPDDAKRNPGTNVRNLCLPQWRKLAEDPAHRCMIPLTEFCEWTPEKHDLGDGKPIKGEMWFEVTDQPIFAIAGFWRQLGDDRTFAMVTCKPNELVEPIHPKAMITILPPEDHERWLTCPG